MMAQSFTYQIIEKAGTQFHLLTANEYPWINIQVFTFPEADHDAIIAKLNAREDRWVIEYPERRDFALMQAGGVAKEGFRMADYDPHQFVADIRTCLEQAATAWATQTNIIYKKE